MAIDMGALRAAIAAKALPESNVGVTRRFLEQVERELLAGQEALAQLNQARREGRGGTRRAGA